jgi:hypothetical protein
MQAYRFSRDGAELFDVDGLGQIAKGPVLDRGHGGLQRRASGDENHRDVEVVGADGLQQSHAPQAGHVDVAQDDVEGRPADGLDARLSVEADFDVVAVRREHAGV